MDGLRSLVTFLIFLSCSKSITAKWNWTEYDISRSYFKDEDPWAVDRCPASKFKGTTVLEMPEDCTRYQKCWWIDSEDGTPKNTIVVQAASCFKCNEPECPQGRMVYYPPDKKCYPPHQITEAEHKCGTKVEPECDGPEDSETVHRLGQSRFYLIQNEEKSGWVNWYGAQDTCKALGLKLAKIDNLQTEIYVARSLEKFIRNNLWPDNFYWLDAKFDRELKTYVWQDTNEPIKFSNFYFRPPRPKGYGEFFDIKGNFVASPTQEHCLAQSMPLPFPKTQEDVVPYAMHTSWWERLCNSSKKGNTLCESTNPGCEVKNSTDSRSTATVALSEYYYEDFWPISNRRFVVWRSAHNCEDAKALCESHNLKLYVPRDGDTCLLYDLKRWNLEMNSYSFWTDLTYKVADRQYYYPNGTVVPLHLRNMTVNMRTSSKYTVDETCVSYTWNFENYPSNVNFCKCNTNSLVLSPENCVNPIGVICQHPDAEERECFEDRQHTEFDYKEFYEFDSKKLGLTRSAYKQPGNGGICPSGFERITEQDTYWEPEEGYDFGTSSFQYDFLSHYWLAWDDEKTCLLSKVNYDADTKAFTREITEGNCNKWMGFILCKKIDESDAEQDEVAETDVDPSCPGCEEGLGIQTVKSPSID